METLSHRVGSVVVQSHVNLTGPFKNYQVDDHTFESAEHVSLKSKPGLVRTLIAEAQGDRVSRRGKSVTGFNQRMGNFFSNVHVGEASVGLILRFHNSQMRQPRLTMYEHIVPTQKLEK